MIDIVKESEMFYADRIVFTEDENAPECQSQLLGFYGYKICTVDVVNVSGYKNATHIFYSAYPPTDNVPPFILVHSLVNEKPVLATIHAYYTAEECIEDYKIFIPKADYLKWKTAMLYFSTTESIRVDDCSLFADNYYNVTLLKDKYLTTKQKEEIGFGKVEQPTQQTDYNYNQQGYDYNQQGYDYNQQGYGYDQQYNTQQDNYGYEQQGGDYYQGNSNGWQ